MAKLRDYKRKRDFLLSPEPAPGGVELGGARFVVQRHDARRLHYDLRLERAGVLASWALPRGLPIVPGAKQLAIRTEDHPVEYLTFEGEIPQGSYGAGTMEVWDDGHYELIEDKADGGLTVRLHGERLAGTWALVPARLDGKDANWLALCKEATRNTGPRPTYSPTLASASTVLPSGSEWVHEIKWDGYRALCVLEAGEPTLLSRGGKDYTERFASVVAALPRAVRTPNCVLDGEVCALDDAGRPSFALMQASGGELVYYVFDLLELDGVVVTDLSLSERRVSLERHILPSATIRISETFADGDGLLAAVREQGLEGVVSKRLRSPYAGGRRTRNWLKTKPRQAESFAIVGYTRGSGHRRSSFGALVLAERCGEGLRWVGNCGTGFSDQDLEVLAAALEPLATLQPPLSEPPGLSRAVLDGIVWVTPQLLCQIEYVERTPRGVLRAASYRGLVEADQPSSRLGERAMTDERTITERGGELTVRNLGKVFWPEDGLTKGDLIAYYENVSAVLVPHLSDRPFTMKRFPNGIDGKHFFQKNAPSHIPEWIPTRSFKTVSRESGEPRTIDYPLVNDKLALLWMASMGCIDLNVPLSRVDLPSRPDMALFDLDPSADSGFRECVLVARLVRDTLAAIGLRGYVKTSGSDGIHVVVPLARRHRFSDTHLLVATIAGALEQLHPGLVTTEFLKRKRRGVLIDANQNGPGRTIASVYSVRPHARAPVSTPLDWDELEEDMDPHELTMSVAIDRIARRGDLFQPVLEDKQSLSRALRELG